MNAVTAMMRLLDLLVAGTVALEQFQAMRARLSQMQAEGRDPSAAEWEALFATIDADAARLNAADRRLNEPRA